MRVAGLLLSLLLVLGFCGGAEAGALDMPFAAQASPDSFATEDGDRLYHWEQDLRWFTFGLLKDVRRYAIRTMRLVRRSADYWLSWLVTSAWLLLFGAFASSVDRRLLALRRERGSRTALIYAAVGAAVFLRLLLDRRISLRARSLVPLALVYGVCAHNWIDLGYWPLELANELLVVGVASRSFVRRCPDEIVWQHAAHVRNTALSRMLVSPSEPGA